MFETNSEINMDGSEFDDQLPLQIGGRIDRINVGLIMPMKKKIN